MLAATLLPVVSDAPATSEFPYEPADTACVAASPDSVAVSSAGVNQAGDDPLPITVIVDDVIIQSDPSSAVSGYVDVYVDVSTGREAYLAGYNVIVGVDPASSGVTLTGADEADDAVFPDQTPTLFGTGDQLLVQDDLAGAGNENLIQDEAGLFRILFQVDAGVSGSFDLDITFLQLFDGEGDPLADIESSGGTITVTASNMLVVVDDGTVYSDPSSPVTGFVDVYFQVPAGREPYMAGYNAIVDVGPASSGLTLTGADEADDAVFPEQTPTVFGTGDQLLVQDDLAGAGNENLIVDGAGLFRILFEVDAGVSGSFDLSISFLQLYDGEGDEILNVDGVGGTITVVSGGVTDGVVGRYVFYNNSFWDGNDPSANANDDDAIAPSPVVTDPGEPAKELGKEALLPGETASFVNYTSYSKGLNGIMVDIAGMTGTPTLADFDFKVGNDNDPTGWSAAPDPQISVRTGAGVGGSDRITLIWADNDPNTATPGSGAIANQWLQVTVLANLSTTALLEDDVFYFGNAVGECGDSSVHAYVTTQDESGVRDNPHSFGDYATISDAYDFDRNAYVTTIEQMIVRNNVTGFGSALELITVPSASPSPAANDAVEPPVLAPAAGADPSPDSVLAPPNVPRVYQILDTEEDKAASADAVSAEPVGLILEEPERLADRIFWIAEAERARRKHSAPLCDGPDPRAVDELAVDFPFYLHDPSLRSSLRHDWQ